MIKKCLLITHFLLLLLSLPLSETAEAQSAEQEVFLQFRHQGVVNTYVSAIYDRNQFFLSVTDLFESLQIDINIDQAAFTLSGNYLGQGPYSLNLDSGQARFLDREMTLSVDDFVITEFGYYLRTEIFYDLFGLEFIVDFSNLSVTLESDETMPVVSQRERERRRERLLRTQRELRRDFYPLQFGRDKSLFNAGFLDYNLTTNISEGSNSYLYSTNIGMELLGGDVQGTVFGSYSQIASSVRSSGLRWRYSIRDNNWISTLSAGQATAEGLAPVAYTGIRLTNDPIEPRYIYNETVFTGTVEPDSEVELFRNNTLIDFAQADGSGTYRFSIPLTYGSSAYTIRVYSPTGEMTERDIRLQIPFNFLPPGEVIYTVNAGRLDNPISGSTDRGMLSRANLSAGITDRLTASGGIEYFEDFHDDLPTFSGKISGRLGSNYLVSMEAANNAFYRASGSVIYPNNASLNVDYTYYNTRGGIYNTSRNQSSVRANLFTPLLTGNWPLFMRWSVTNEQRETGSVTRYRIDMNTRIGRANLRFGYRDSQLGALSFQATPIARLNSSVTYNFSRSRDIPALFRSLFVRAQTNYIPAQSRIEDAEIQFSRNLNRRGRFQISAGRNFIGEFNLFRLALTVDFNNIRSNTSVRSNRNTATLSQSLRGSVGYDSNHNKMLFTNRQQVGRAGVAMRMFVDNNNSGTYDEGDELIPENAIRIDRAGGNTFSKDNINYISQLQPYRQYNMTVNKGAINNPLLVPLLEQFSIVTDPNQYKLIEIPLYMSGIVEGMVYRQEPDGTLSGLGGLRLYMRQVNTPPGSEPFTEEIRTFSDGSFYTYEIPPGEYTLEADPSQLNFLNVVPEQEKLEFEVKTLAEGDFIEGLEIVLLPSDDPQRIAPREVAPVIVASVTSLDEHTTNVGNQHTCNYTIQFGSYDSFLLANNTASAVERLIDSDLQVQFDATNQLYAVRTTSVSVYGRASEMVSTLNEAGYSRLAVLYDCERPEQTAENDHIQIGVFSDRQSAAAFRDQMQPSLDKEVFVYPDRTENVFRVLTGPFQNQSEILAALHILTLDSRVDDLIVDQAIESIGVDTPFSGESGLASFADPDSAQAYIAQYQDQTEERLQIVEGQDGRFRVETEKSVQTPEELQKRKDFLTELAAELTPAVILHESIKPPAIDQALDSVLTGDDQPITTEIHEEVTRPDSLYRDEQPVTEKIDEELLLDTLSLDELIVTEKPGEDLLLDTLTTPISKVEPGEPRETVAEGKAIECRYPIQVGSFRGNATAHLKSEEISARLDTEIHLVYNPAVDLFALRTDPVDHIRDALSQLLSFRETDPGNQYAIVGQCTQAGASDKYSYAEFLIPIVHYDNEIQATQYANTIRNRYEIEMVVRMENNGSQFHIYAGPYPSFRKAVEEKAKISELNIVTDPEVIVDPATSEPFDSVFKIYFGSSSDLQEAESKNKRYLSSTGRQLSIETDQQAIRLFDHTEYRSWSRFLEVLEEVTTRSDLRPVEIFIQD